MFCGRNASFPWWARYSEIPSLLLFRLVSPVVLDSLAGANPSAPEEDWEGDSHFWWENWRDGYQMEVDGAWKGSWDVRRQGIPRGNVCFQVNF